MSLFSVTLFHPNSAFILYDLANFAAKKMIAMYGRDKEKKRLTELMQSGEAEFISLYGRRRVGKTYLIREFFEDKFCFYVSGVLNGKTNEQKAVFKRALEQYD